MGLLRISITINLNNSDSIESFVNQIVSIAHTLKDIEMVRSDEWIETDASQQSLVGHETVDDCPL